MRRARLFLVAESGVDVRLVEGLAARFELSILARRIPGGVEISQPPKMLVPVDVGPSSRLGFSKMAFRTLQKNRREVECIIVQGYGAAALAANLVGRIWNIPTAMLVCSPVEQYYLCRRAALDGQKPFRRRELWALRALARLNCLVGQQYLVLSRHLADVVRGHGARKAVTIVPLYGVDTQIFSPAKEPKSEVRERLKLPARGALIFFSSRLAPEKDAETLLGALRQLIDAGRELWLLNASGGYQSLGEAARRWGIGDRIIAMDAVHPHLELPDLYRACDLCVQASREEGLGFSPLEAMACGVPVVAASVGGLRETIIGGETGWTYKVGDSMALAKSMAEALDNPEEAACRTRAGRAMVCARFEERLVFERLEEVFTPRRRIEPRVAEVELL
jgi:glycosyltransferase involved in cell wall biosynthesis